MELVQGLKVGIIKAWGQGGQGGLEPLGALGPCHKVAQSLKWCVGFVCKWLASKFVRFRGSTMQKMVCSLLVALAYSFRQYISH